MIEVLVILVLIGIFVTVWLPTMPGNRNPLIAPCHANLRTLASGYQSYLMENGNLPFRVPYQNGGLKDPGTNRIQIKGIGDFDPTLRSNAWLQFSFIHPYLGDPKVLLCPADKKRNWGRKSATSWGKEKGGLAASRMQNKCVSYCIGLDAGLNAGGSLDTASTSNQILLTERHMEYDTVNSTCSANVGPTKVVKVNRQGGTNTLAQLGWKKTKPELHGAFGMIALLDGSVDLVLSDQLQDRLKQPGDNGELHFIYP